ncbi:MAG: AAA family ATPase [Arenibacterium sp.]
MSDMRVSNIAELVANIEAIPSGPNPLLVALAGAPGSGKSTIAEILHAKTARPSCVIPMDGFHLANEALRKRGLLHRKGSPETFDLEGFHQLIVELRSKTARCYPTFDRNADQTVTNGGIVPAETELFLVEGNYLLLDKPGWRDLHELWDVSVWLDVPTHILKDRLIQRWTEQGLSNVDARQRAEQNDLVNANLVTGHRLTSTWSLVRES